MTRPMIQAAKTRLVVPVERAMSLLTRKIPVPMVSPMTTAVAAQRPRPRISSDCVGWSVWLAVIGCGVERLLSASGAVNQCDTDGLGYLVLLTTTGTPPRLFVSVDYARVRYSVNPLDATLVNLYA